MLILISVHLGFNVSHWRWNGYCTVSNNLIKPWYNSMEVGQSFMDEMLNQQQKFIFIFTKLSTSNSIFDYLPHVRFLIPHRQFFFIESFTIISITHAYMVYYLYWQFCTIKHTCSFFHEINIWHYSIPLLRQPFCNWKKMCLCEKCGISLRDNLVVF